MTPTGTIPKFALATDPMLANIQEVTDKKFELVIIYGYVGKVTDDTVRLHQCLDLRKFYEIPTNEVVYAENVTCPEGRLTKIVLFSTTRITYVSGAKATLPAGSLAEVVADRDQRGEQPDPEYCQPYCQLNGRCVCAPVDYWLHLDQNKASRLGVEVLTASHG